MSTAHSFFQETIICNRKLSFDNVINNGGSGPEGLPVECLELSDVMLAFGSNYREPTQGLLSHDTLILKT